MSRIRELSADEEARRLAFVRERALRDEVSLLNDAKREGREEVASKARTVTLSTPGSMACHALAVQPCAFGRESGSMERRNPKALATLLMVEKAGLPSPDRAL